MSKPWISIHIFYYGDQNALIVNCIAPLVDALREQALIQRSFFIRYWTEGVHVRLRLLPADNGNHERIKSLAEQAIAAYLKQFPGLYKPDPRQNAQTNKELFIAEYGQEKWDTIYGDHNPMLLRPNNTFASIDYEPEYDRYGGSLEAMDLAEWHFEHSSETVINLLQEFNTNVSSILLGWSIQLILSYFYGVFEDDQKVLVALERYMTNWQRWNQQYASRYDQFEKKYQHMAPALGQRVLQIRNANASDRLTPLERRWKTHLGELRQRIARLYHEQKVTPVLWHGPDNAFTLDDVFYYLLSSYVHMTNNRLGVLIPQEVYLSFLLKRALEDLLVGESMEVARR